MPCERIDHDLPTYQDSALTQKLTAQLIQRVSARRRATREHETIRGQATTGPSQAPASSGRAPAQPTQAPFGLTHDPLNSNIIGEQERPSERTRSRRDKGLRQ